MLKTHSKSIGVSLFLTVALALISATALWAASESITLSCTGGTHPSSISYQGTEDSCCYAAQVLVEAGGPPYIYEGGGSSDESTFCCAQELMDVAESHDGMTCTCVTGCS